MKMVIDTSVTIAWYLPESFSQQARGWLEKIVSGQVIALAPSLHYLEFANVLRTRIRQKQLTIPLATEIVASHANAPLRVTDPSRSRILATALEFDATAYDAAFIALAREHACPLLTAERATTPWVAKLGKQAITLEE
jgi:predicted nucleic acid-binding protein